jgi:hypothetical protein
MSAIWGREYQSDNTFFGDEPSNFATLSFDHMKSNNVKKVLEIGAGHGRDALFFALNGLEVEALDPRSLCFLHYWMAKRTPTNSKAKAINSVLEIVTGFV